jgi:hypothetical protein
MAMFIIWKVITYLDESCEEVYVLEKDMKGYPLDPFPFFSSNNEKYVENKLRISKITKLENQVKVMCNEVASL